MKLALVSGAGNRFAVASLFDGALTCDPAELARRVCRAPLAGGARLDGLLLVGPAERAGAAARMIVHNADGSRPETCGNGLRCAARLLRERGAVHEERFEILTDAGPVAVVAPERGDVSVRLGSVRVLERIVLDVPDATAPGRRRPLALAVIDAGNPHAVAIVDDERLVPLASWGPCIERHARFPAGTNVGFAAVRDGRRHLRVWERGVGETQACGSGACAAATWLVESGLGAWPVELELLGGRLRVDQDERGRVWLTGPALTFGELDVDDAAGVAAIPKTAQERRRVGEPGL